MASRARLVARACAAVSLLLLVPACGSASDPPGSTPREPPVGSSPPASGGASCGAVRTAADDLRAAVKGWRSGDESRGELVASGRALASAVASRAGAEGVTDRRLTSLTRAVTGFVSTAINSSAERDVDRAWAGVASAVSAFGDTCR